MKNKTILSILTIIFFSSGCEKRIPVDVDFPYEKDRLFCEIIGITGIGFYGQISIINEVQSNATLRASYDLTIEEDGIIMAGLESTLTQFFIPFDVDQHKKYSLQLRYDNRLVTSPETAAPPPLQLRHLNAQNDYIDSLGFKVVTYSFDIDAINSIEEQFYSYTTQLTNTSSILLNPLSFGEVGVIKNDTSTHIQHRIPNMEDRRYLKVGLIAIKKPLFQYLKNIKKLGSIPNDNIAGHQGNLTGGIGYFGIIDFEEEEVMF